MFLPFDTAALGSEMLKYSTSKILTWVREVTPDHPAHCCTDTALGSEMLVGKPTPATYPPTPAAYPPTCLSFWVQLIPTRPLVYGMFWLSRLL